MRYAMEVERIVVFKLHFRPGTPPRQRFSSNRLIAYPIIDICVQAKARRLRCSVLLLGGGVMGVVP